MSGPWEKYKKAEPAADGPWAKYKQPEEPVEESLNPFAGASLGENAQAAWETAKEFGGALNDRATSFNEAYNPLAPAAHVAGNAVGALFDPNNTYDDYVRMDNEEKAARDARTPGLYKLAGTIGNPVNKLSGLQGVAASVGVNAANNELEALALDSGKSQGDIGKDTATEAAIGVGANFLPKAVAPIVKAGTEKLQKFADGAAVNSVKKAFNATAGQMAEYGIKGDEMVTAAKKMLKDGFFDKAVQTREDLYRALRDRMSRTGADMDAIAEEYGEGITRGNLSDLLAGKGAEARHLGQDGLESAYKSKGQAFLSPETVAAQKGLAKIDKALDKPKFEYDKLGDQTASMGRKSGIQNIKQELLNDSNLRDDSLVRQLRQSQIDDQLAAIGERGEYLGAKNQFSADQQQGLLETRANLQDVLDDGRAEILSTADLRKARIKEDARAYPSEFAVDQDKAEIAATLRDAEMGSIKDPDAAAFYKKHKQDYAELVPAEKMTLKSAASDERKGLLNQIGNARGRALGGTAGFAIAGPAGAVVGQQLGSFGQDLLNKYGNQLGAYGFNKASKVLQNQQWSKTLLEAGERGGAAGVGTAHFLLTQRDPAYRQAHQEDQDASKDK